MCKWCFIFFSIKIPTNKSLNFNDFGAYPLGLLPYIGWKTETEYVNTKKGINTLMTFCISVGCLLKTIYDDFLAYLFWVVARNYGPKFEYRKLNVMESGVCFQLLLGKMVFDENPKQKDTNFSFQPNWRYSKVECFFQPHLKVFKSSVFFPTKLKVFRSYVIFIFFPEYYTPSLPLKISFKKNKTNLFTKWVIFYTPSCIKMTQSSQVCNHYHVTLTKCFFWSKHRSKIDL